MNRCKYYSNDGHCKKYSDRETMQFCVEGPCIEEHKSKLVKFMSRIENWAAGFYDKFLADNKRKFTRGDSIRAMTDCELAYFLEMKAGRFVSFATDQAENWLDWLKQEIDV